MEPLLIILLVVVPILWNAHTSVMRLNREIARLKDEALKKELADQKVTWDRDYRSSQLDDLVRQRLNPYYFFSDAHYDCYNALRASLSLDEEGIVWAREMEERLKISKVAGKPSPEGVYGLFGVEGFPAEEGHFVGVPKGAPVERYNTLDQAKAAWLLKMTDCLGEWGTSNKLTIRKLLDSQWVVPSD